MSSSIYKITDFSDKNVFKFKIITNDVLEALMDRINLIQDCNNIEDIKNELFEKDAGVFTEIAKVTGRVLEIIKLDYSDTEVQSQKEGWDFYYFFGESQTKPEAFLVLANLFYPENSSEKGNVIYNVVAIKKKKDSYFVWNMLE